MPVKVRCSSCDRVLTAPDQARGQAIRCPHCEARVRVPNARGKGAAARMKKKRVPQMAGSDDNFLADIDLSRVEDRDTAVCSRCGAVLGDEDRLCPQCGIDQATGKKPVRRRGPNPAKFYSEVWTDSWEFLRKNRSLAVLTGLVWSVFILLFLGSVVFTQVVFNSEFKSISGNVDKAKKPISSEVARVQAQRSPPVVFGYFLITLMALGGPGWYWHLSRKVIQATMEKKRLKRASFEFFGMIAIGLKAMLWPFILLLPIFGVAAVLVGLMALSSISAFGDSGFLRIIQVLFGISLLAIFAFPIAQVHMTMPYTYKAFLPVDMLKLFLRNSRPVLYWLLIALVVLLPFVIFGVVAGLFSQEIAASIQKQNPLNSATKWFLLLIGERPEIIEMKGFFYQCIFSTLAILLGLLVVTPLSFTAAFAAVFLMRANGLLGYYFKNRLELVREQKPNIPCGFWVRYLATVIDGLLLSATSGVLYVAVSVASGLITDILGNDVMGERMMLVSYLAMVVIPFLYFTRSESGIGQGTLGKRAMGIIVTDLEGKRITANVAVGRFFGRLFSGVIAGIGFIMAAFTPNKQTLHDQLTKTMVMWIGDEFTTQ